MTRNHASDGRGPSPSYHPDPVVGPAASDQRATKHTSTLLLSLAGASLIVGMSGCDSKGSTTSPEELNELKAMHSSICAKDEALDTHAAVDISASIGKQTIKSAWLPAVRAELSMAAVCGTDKNSSTVEIKAFAGNAAGAVLFSDNEVTPSGATLPARLRRVDEVVESAMKIIEAELDKLYAAGNRGGTNIAAQLTEAAAFFDQAPGERDAVHRVVVLTDGRATASTTSSIALPANATVLIAGVGTVAENEKPMKQNTIDGAISSLTALCETTGAAECTVTTHYNNPADK